MAVEVQRRTLTLESLPNDAQFVLSNGQTASHHLPKERVRRKKQAAPPVGPRSQTPADVQKNDCVSESTSTSQPAKTRNVGPAKRKRANSAQGQPDLRDEEGVRSNKKLRLYSPEPPTSTEEDSTEPSSAKQSRQYLCDFEGCGRAFKKSSKLRRHERTHFDEVCLIMLSKIVMFHAFSEDSSFPFSARSHAPSPDVQKHTSAANI